MSKNNVTEITNEQAFTLGVKCKEDGFSEHYNPYRNLDTQKDNIAELQNSWFKGYNSED